MDKLIKLFQTMRNRVAQAFGYIDRKEAPDSFLIDALMAINAIEHRLGKLGGQTHQVNLNEMSTKTLSRVAPKNHLLFQVAGLTASTTNKTASEVFKDIVDTSLNISKEHGQYLQSLFDSVNQAILDKSNGKLPFAVNYAQAWDLVQNSDLAQDAKMFQVLKANRLFSGLLRNNLHSAFLYQYDCLHLKSYRCCCCFLSNLLSFRLWFN